MGKKLKLVTHNGSFHTDDVFAAAALSLWLEKKGEDFEIIRSRDEEVIKGADYVFDVGGIYDESKNRFDHHQPGGAGKRPALRSLGEGEENGIEYSSFGLIWKKIGEDLVGDREAVDIIDSRLVAPIDAHDNGIDLVEKKHVISPYLIQDFFRAMCPTWREDKLNVDDMFLKSVEIAKQILSREIIHAKDVALASKSIREIYDKSEDKRILIFDKNYTSSEALAELPEVMFAVYPRSSDNYWGMKATRDNYKSFKNRKDLPKEWSGLRGEELQKVTGVEDAVFCHRALFMAVAESKEGAIKLAELALSR